MHRRPPTGTDRFGRKRNFGTSLCKNRFEDFIFGPDQSNETTQVMPLRGVPFKTLGVLGKLRKRTDEHNPTLLLLRREVQPPRGEGDKARSERRHYS